MYNATSARTLIKRLIDGEALGPVLEPLMSRLTPTVTHGISPV